MNPKKAIPGSLPADELWDSLLRKATAWQAGPFAHRLGDPAFYAELIDKVAAGCPLMLLASAAIAFIGRLSPGVPGKKLLEAIESAGRRIDTEPVLAARLRRDFLPSVRLAQARYAESGNPTWIAAIAAVSVWRLRQTPDDTARCYLRSAN